MKIHFLVNTITLTKDSCSIYDWMLVIEYGWKSRKRYFKKPYFTASNRHGFGNFQPWRI